MPASASRTREHALRGLLLGTPRKVLARILPGDPLGLRQRVAAGLDRRSLALDPDESHLAALARVAHAASRWSGGEPLAGWLDRQVDAALDDRMREEAHAVREGAAVGDGPSVLRDLARPLEVGPEQLRAACAALNHRPTVERRAFVRIVLDREDPEDAARMEGVSLNALACRARAALLAVLEAFETTPWDSPASAAWPTPIVQETAVQVAAIQATGIQAKGIQAKDIQDEDADTTDPQTRTDAEGDSDERS